MPAAITATGWYFVNRPSANRRCNGLLADADGLVEKVSKLGMSGAALVENLIEVEERGRGWRTGAGRPLRRPWPSELSSSA
jgi:hypothetical protein